MTTFLQLLVIGFSTGSAFALVGMSLVLVYRTTGIVNFAQGVFAVIGGLFTFQLSDDMPLALAALFSVFIAAFAASILAVVAVGFRGRTTSLASTIITLGAAFLAQALLLLKFGDIPRSYPGISDRAWDVGGVLVQPQYVLIAGVALLGVALSVRSVAGGAALVDAAAAPVVAGFSPWRGAPGLVGAVAAKRPLAGVRGGVEPDSGAGRVGACGSATAAPAAAARGAAGGDFGGWAVGCRDPGAVVGGVVPGAD